MMIGSYYLNDIALILKDLEKQDKRLTDAGSDGMVFLDGPLALVAEGGGKVGEIHYVDSTYYFVPNEETFKDLYDLNDPEKALFS